MNYSQLLALQYLHFHSLDIRFSASNKGVAMLLGDQANKNSNYHSHSYHNGFDHTVQCHQDGYMYCKLNAVHYYCSTATT